MLIIEVLSSFNNMKTLMVESPHLMAMGVYPQVKRMINENAELKTALKNGYEELISNPPERFHQCSGFKRAFG